MVQGLIQGCLRHEDPLTSLGLQSTLELYMSMSSRLINNNRRFAKVTAAALWRCGSGPAVAKAW